VPYAITARFSTPLVFRPSQEAKAKEKRQEGGCIEGRTYAANYETDLYFLFRFSIQYHSTAFHHLFFFEK
jgi:hypothetical protein